KPSPYLPHWAEQFFCVPVTRLQFLLFTLVLAGPSLYVIVWRAGDPFLATVAAIIAFGVNYVVFIVVCIPVALLDPKDSPLHKLLLAETIWSWFGYRPGKPSLHTHFYRFSLWLQGWISTLVRKLRLLYLLDPDTQLVYPVHFLSITIATVLLAFWFTFDWLAN